MSWLSEVERVGAWDLEEKGEKGRKLAKIMTQTFATKYVYRADKGHLQMYFTYILQIIPGDLARVHSSTPGDT